MLTFSSCLSFNLETKLKMELAKLILANIYSLKRNPKETTSTIIVTLRSEEKYNFGLNFLFKARANILA